MVTRKIREGHEYNWMRIRVMECVKIEIIKKRASKDRK